MSKFPRFSALYILCIGTLSLAQAQSGFKYFDVTDTSTTPKLLSQTGLYANIATKALIADAVRFDVNSPLWSDASAKLRWILLKKGTTVAFREKDDYWDYPDSAVFIKQFAIDTVPGDTTSRRIWETRLLVNHKEHPAGDSTLPKVDRWYGFSYKWRKNGSDADLVSLEEGNNDTIKVYPKGKAQPAVMKKWHFPTQHECTKCHVPTLAATQARSVLGFYTAQLNRPYWRGTGNQLDTLFARGVLSGTKAAWAQSPRWYGVNDSTAPGATVDNRARAYIAANCSGCHGVRGNANHASAFVAFIYDFHEGVPGQDLRWQTVRRGDYVKDVEPKSVTPGLVVPGYPQKSLLLFRQAQRNGAPGDFSPNAAEMPPLASFEVNQDAVNLITRWILEMDTNRVAVRGAPALAAGPARLEQGFFVLPPDLRLGADGKTVRVIMGGIDGRTWVLKSAGAGRYPLPANAPRGVYAFRAGLHSVILQRL